MPGYGWIPDLPDFRDLHYVVPEAAIAALPASVSLREQCPDVYDQGYLGAGFPFVFGLSVYESFETEEVAKTGDAPLPAHGEKLLGGHAVLAVGYDDSTGRFQIRNSWGEGWGKEGYFTLPYEYLTDG